MRGKRIAKQEIDKDLLRKVRGEWKPFNVIEARRSDAFSAFGSVEKSGCCCFMFCLFYVSNVFK